MNKIILKYKIIKNDKGMSPKERIDFMSLTRKLLKGMQLTDEQIETIISEHTETVNGIKEDLDALTEKNEQLQKEVKKTAKVQKELDDLKQSIEQAKDGNPDPYEEKYNVLKAEFDKYKSDIDEEKERAKKEKAYRKLLKESGISEKRIDSVLKLAKVDGKLEDMEFDDKEEVKGADKLKEEIKADYSEYVQKEGVDLAKPATPPGAGEDASGTISRASKLAQQYHENLYGATKKE